MLWFWNVKMGNERKNTEAERNLNGEMPKLPKHKRSILLWERWLNEKPNVTPLEFFLYLQNHTFKTQPHERISFNRVDVYIILNVSRRKYRHIRYLCQLHTCDLPTFSFLGTVWSLAEAAFEQLLFWKMMNYRNKLFNSMHTIPSSWRKILIFFSKECVNISSVGNLETTLLLPCYSNM